MNKKTKQKIIGRVVSEKTIKTVVVLVEREKMHPMYKKSFRRSKRYLVHDEIGAKLGDLVEIVQVRPISKNKHLQIQKIVGKNMEAVVIEELKEKAAEAIAEVMPVEEESRVKSLDSSEKNDKNIESRVEEKESKKRIRRKISRS